MEMKKFNGRFIPKGDTEANWNKAVGFVPLDKEIIIYKADEKNSMPRIKIGDGKTDVNELPFGIEIDGVASKNWVTEQINASTGDYEQNNPLATDYIKNRPFYDTRELLPSKKYSLIADSDFDFQNTEKVRLDSSRYLVLVSEDLLSINQCVGATFNMTVYEGASIESSYSHIIDKSDIAGYKEEAYIILATDIDGIAIIKNTEQALEDFDINFPSVGIYLPYYTDAIESGYSYNMELITVESSENGEIKKLDSKFLPESIATKEYADENTRDFKINYVDPLCATATVSQIQAIFNKEAVL